MNTLRNKIAKKIVEQKRQEMQIHNNTEFPSTSVLETIRSMEKVGVIKNNWRQRMVTLYSSPNPTKLYMIGVAFDGSSMVISHEDIGMNEGIAMDYWKNGQKTLVRD